MRSQKKKKCSLKGTFIFPIFHLLFTFSFLAYEAWESLSASLWKELEWLWTDGKTHHLVLSPYAV